MRLCWTFFFQVLKIILINAFLFFLHGTLPGFSGNAPGKSLSPLTLFFLGLEFDAKRNRLLGPTPFFFFRYSHPPFSSGVIFSSFLSRFLEAFRGEENRGLF